MIKYRCWAWGSVLRFILGFVLFFASGIVQAQSISCQDIFLGSEENHFLTYELYRKWQDRQNDFPILSVEEELLVLAYAEKELKSRGVQWLKLFPSDISGSKNSLPHFHLSHEGVHPLNQLAKALSEVNWAGGSRMLISLDPHLADHSTQLFEKTYLFSQTKSTWEIHLPWFVAEKDLKFDPMYLRSLRWLESQKPVFLLQPIPWNEMLWPAPDRGMFRAKNLLKELIDLEAGMMQMYQGARAFTNVSSELDRSFEDLHLQMKKTKLENDLVDQKQKLLTQFQKALDLISQGADGLRWMKTKEFEKDLLSLKAPEKLLKKKEAPSRFIYKRSEKETASAKINEQFTEIIQGQVRPFGEVHFGIANFVLPSSRLLGQGTRRIHQNRNITQGLDPYSQDRSIADRAEMLIAVEALLNNFQKLHGKVLFLQSKWKGIWEVGGPSDLKLQILLKESMAELQGYPYLWEKTYESLSVKRKK
jgi:hypothetical protein